MGSLLEKIYRVPEYQIEDESLQKKLPPCTVCLDAPMQIPIYQCYNGHLLCNYCENRVHECPTCREFLSKFHKIRNRAMENVQSWILCCKNMKNGCEAAFLSSRHLENHQQNCPLSVPLVQEENRESGVVRREEVQDEHQVVNEAWDLDWEEQVVLGEMAGPVHPPVGRIFRSNRNAQRIHYNYEELGHDQYWGDYWGGGDVEADFPPDLGNNNNEYDFAEDWGDDHGILRRLFRDISEDSRSDDDSGIDGGSVDVLARNWETRAIDDVDEDSIIYGDIDNYLGWQARSSHHLRNDAQRQRVEAEVADDWGIDDGQRRLEDWGNDEDWGINGGPLETTDIGDESQRMSEEDYYSSADEDYYDMS